jgi:quercetin dioxygenase-like cupin family protein
MSHTMRPSLRRPDAWFTGNVWIDEIVTGNAPSRMKAIRVTFPPGERPDRRTYSALIKPASAALNVCGCS